jgi:transcriptional regulator of acetoin/glycerol metabolism
VLQVILQCEQPRAASRQLPLSGVQSVVLGRAVSGVPEESVPNESGDLRVEFADGRVSASHARLTRVGAEWFLEDLGSRNGVFVKGERIRRLLLRSGDVFRIGHTFLRMVVSEPAVDSPEVSVPAGITLDPKWTASIANVLRPFRLGVPILIEGEPGTGKASLAVALGEAVGCANATRVACEGLSPEALSAAWMAATGKLLLLEHVERMTFETQATLGALLEERDAQLQQGKAPLVPAVAATSGLDLDERLRDGRLRSGVMAKLATHRLRVPPMRDRRGDLGLMIGRALGGMGDGATRVEPRAFEALVEYAWPMNLHELTQVLRAQRAMDHALIQWATLPEAIARPAKPAVVVASAPPMAKQLTPKDLERRSQLVRLLDQHRGNISAVARELGKARMQIQRWLRR